MYIYYVHLYLYLKTYICRLIFEDLHLSLSLKTYGERNK